MNKTTENYFFTLIHIFQLLQYLFSKWLFCLLFFRACSSCFFLPSIQWTLLPPKLGSRIKISKSTLNKLIHWLVGVAFDEIWSKTKKAFIIASKFACILQKRTYASPYPLLLLYQSVSQFLTLSQEVTWMVGG